MGLFRIYIVLLSIGLFLYEKDFAYLNIPTGSLPIYVTEGAIVLFLPSIISRATYSGELHLPGRLQSVLILLWLFLGAFNLMRSPSLDVTALRNCAISYYSLFFFAGYFFSRTTINYLGLLRLFMITSILAASGRIVGSVAPGVDWLPLFNILPFGFIVILLFVWNPQTEIDKIILYATIVVGLVAILFSYLNRSAFLGIFSAILFCNYWGPSDLRRKFKWFLPLLLVVALVGAYFFNVISVDEDRLHYLAHSGTTEWRLYVWAESIFHTLNNYPFFGSGFGFEVIPFDAIPDSATALHPHNVLITIFSQQGIIGVGLFILIVLNYFYNCILTFRKYSFHQRAVDYRLLLGLAAYVLLCLIFALFNVALEGPHHGIWFWLAMGASYDAMRRLSKLPSFSRPRPIFQTRPVTGT